MKLLFAILCLLALSACSRKDHEEAAPAKPVVEVKTAKAEGASVALRLTAPATIFPKEQANITPRLTGVIRELRARKGDTVSAGALLGMQDNRDLTAQRDEAQAAVADAQANLDKVRRGTNPAELERARGQVETTRALLNQAQKMLDRRKALFDQGAIPQRDLLVSETELSTAKTNFDVATRTLTLLEQQTQGQDVRIAEARVAQAKSRLATVTAQLQFAEIRAPFNGTLTEQFQYAGDLGQPASPIFTLADLSMASARAQVPEGEVSALRIGQRCTFQGGEDVAMNINGSVKVINRAVDAQRRTVEVWCEIAGPPSTLRVGAFGKVLFETSALRDSVLVPITALQLEEGTRKGFVLVVDSQQVAHRREVEVGDVDGDRRTVLTGLKAGETVITEGGYEMPDGTKVKASGSAGK
jgi:HlyD family secretion protein